MTRPRRKLLALVAVAALVGIVAAGYFVWRPSPAERMTRLMGRLETMSRWNPPAPTVGDRLRSWVGR